ncbi:phenylacetate--CoA ligase family protein [bacterium]|nr:phenylacetate--CoA ligase family protein [bacterium]MBU1900948.1 phenylacetate--CoA ligase family protein [Patescibacteria group bacterium]
MDHLKELRKLQFLSRTELLEYQANQLKKILRHAHKNVPYYQQVLEKAGVIQGNKVNLKKFDQIPILTKDIIRQEKERIYSKDRDQRKYYENASGGSTGEPVSIIQDAFYRDRSWANKILYNEAIGDFLGDPEIKLWGSERDIFQGSLGLRARLQNYVWNRVLLNSFRMTEKEMADYVEKINEFKPVLIWSYIDSLYELARFIEANNLKVHSPVGIFVTAGTVYPSVKEYIGKIFKAPVYNQYGSREAGDMATECKEKKGLHVYEYLYYFEILNEELKPCKPGEIGEIYVTSLINYSMPMIRYKIGDTASFLEDQTCPCGRNLVLINDVHGRITDHFQRRDKALIHGEYFTHLFYFRPWIKKFQVRQSDYELIDCYIVKDLEEEAKDMEDISQKIKLVMGKECKVNFRFVNNIPPSRSGKFLFTVSEVNR